MLTSHSRTGQKLGFVDVRLKTRFDIARICPKNG